MKCTVSGAAFGLVLAAAAPSWAAQLKPLDGYTVAIKQYTVSVFYLDRGDTYEAVTTILNRGDRAADAPIRSVSHLAPGQSAMIEFGRIEQAGENAPAHSDALLLRRDLHGLTVEVGQVWSDKGFQTSRNEE
jgi:hypothetical protein